MSIALDVKYAARLLLKKPAFSAVSVMIVAIGLGLTVYCYTLLNQLVFQPIRFADNQPIMALESMFDQNHLFRQPADPFHLYRAQNELNVISELGFYQQGTTFVGGGNTNIAPKKYNSSYISWHMFGFTGVNPLLGRGFNQDDHKEGAEPSVILSYKVWQNQFNGDPNIVGKMTALDAEPGRIIGVMPEGFAFPAVAEIWQPLGDKQVNPTQSSFSSVYAFAKLRPGVTVIQAQNRLNELNKELSTLPGVDSRRINANGEYLWITPFKRPVITQYYTMFIGMFVVVFLILLLACINIGNLLLARVNERIKEVAIRLALGVPRGRLVLQMLWESLFICTLGGFIGLLLAGWALEVSNQVFSNLHQVDNLRPFWWHLELDAQALWLTLGAVLIMVLVTGLIPAWRALGSDFNAILRDGTRGAMGKKAARANQALVISEILLSCMVLVIATTILITSYLAGTADYGVDTNQRLTATLQLHSSDYNVRWDSEHEFADRVKRAQFYYRLKAALEKQNNVHGVAFMSELPGRGEGTSYFGIEGRILDVFEENPYSNNELVTADSWAPLKMQIIQGRDFDQRDAAQDMRSIIVNQSIARDFFPDGDAVGKRVRRLRRNGEHGEWYTIVGVVSDTFHGSTMRSSSTAYNTYHVLDNIGPFRMTLAMHYSGSEDAARRTLIDALDKVDPNVGLYHIRSYDNLIKQPMMLVIAVSKVFLLCGIIAAVLAATGIYAVAANSISQRSQEIGIRRALGASDGRIFRLFLSQAALQLLVGLSIGLGLSLWLLNYVSQSMILHPGSYVVGLLGVPVTIAIIVLLATYLPTRKVVAMEPNAALHYN